MGLDEFLDFSSSAYAAELRNLSNAELQVRKKKESREYTSNSVSLGIGANTLVPTAGLRAIWMGIAARKLDIADKKTDLLEEELQRRGLDGKFELSGVDVGSVAAGSVTGLVMGNAYQSQASEEGLAGVDVGDSAATIAGNIYGDLTNKSSTKMAETTLTEEWAEDIRSALGCKSPAGTWPAASRVTCKYSQETIKRGLFAHYRERNNHDICHSCHSHRIRRPQANAGPKAEVRQGALYGPSDREAVKRALRVKFISCDPCGKPVLQGRFYTCKVCYQHHSGYDICPNCYFNGAKCLKPQEHSLYVFLAGINPPGNASAYTGPIKSGVVGCNHCKETINQGPYFKCQNSSCQSKNENFVTCYRCYEEGLSCRDSTHPLALILAYGKTWQKRDIYKGEVRCDACKEEMTGEYFFHCRKCRKGNIDLCAACVYTGARCLDSKHVLDRVLSDG